MNELNKHNLFHLKPKKSIQFNHTVTVHVDDESIGCEACGSILFHLVKDDKGKDVIGFTCVDCKSEHIPPPRKIPEPHVKK